jgi:hypothetical protein
MVQTATTGSMRRAGSDSTEWVTENKANDVFRHSSYDAPG